VARSGTLWNQAQGAEERVEDYVTRLRKAARRLELPPEVLHYAVINGLRGPIRLHVVQQGVKSLDDTIRAAKVAEAAASTTPDVIPMMMLDAMKATAQASEKQAAELKQLAARVATLSTAAVVAAAPAEPIMAVTGQPQGQRRALRPTPQNQQRQAYAQRAANRTDGGPRSFARTDQQPQQQSQRPACGRCGWSHQPGNCPADRAAVPKLWQGRTLCKGLQECQGPAERLTGRQAARAQAERPTARASNNCCSRNSSVEFSPGICGICTRESPRGYRSSL
jgi:hypothetical protein